MNTQGQGHDSIKDGPPGAHILTNGGCVRQALCLESLTHSNMKEDRGVENKLGNLASSACMR